MTTWQKPSFEELAMNAEIGAYQSEQGDDDRRYAPRVQAAQQLKSTVVPPAWRTAAQDA